MIANVAVTPSQGSAVALSLVNGLGAAVERMEAHQVLVDHQPVARWLGWRLSCSRCGGRYPCPAREAALDELAGRAREWWWR